MNEPYPVRTSPRTMRTVLYMIADVARRNKFSPVQLLTVFEGGVAAHWVRHQDARDTNAAPVSADIETITEPILQADDKCSWLPSVSSVGDVLSVIERVAERYSFTPDQVVGMLNEGLVMIYWRKNFDWGQALANTAQPATESVAHTDAE